MKTSKNFYQKTVIYLTIIATIFWSMSFSFLFPSMPASAAVLVTPSTINLLNGYFSGAPIKASSNPTAIVKLEIATVSGSGALQAVTVNFSTTSGNFATTSLANIAADATSGVAIYNDAGATASYYDGADVLVATSTGWTADTSNITLTAQPAIALTTSTSTFYVVIKTSATISNDYFITATIPANGIVTSSGNGPSSNFIAPSFKADSTAPSITSVTGTSASNDLTVTFSEPVQKSGGGALTASQFTFVDKGTVTTHSTSTVVHTMGQAWATVTLTGVDSGDFDDTPSTLTAAASGITDMAGNAMLTTASNLTSPITITTSVVPTATTTAVYGAGNPLVTFAASGGNGSYTWSALNNTLTPTNLSLNSSTGALTGTATSSTGSYQVNIKVQDSATPIASTTKNFTINIGTAGGAVPGISSITPAGGAQGSTATSTFTGTNTSFSSSSIVQFLLNGAVDGNVTVGAKTVSSVTSITVPITIAADAATGNRDLKITTGAQIAYLPNAFTVFASGGSSGLGINLPTNAATEVQMPPNFNFNPSTNVNATSYRITVKSTSDFSGNAMWDYAFPNPTVATANNMTSHCTSNICNVSYGAGQFMVITQPTPLSANTTYYWNVRTYSQMPFNISDSIVPLETAAVRSFTTTASVNDSVPPSIMHRQLFSATASANLNLFARVMDNLATASTTPALSTKLIYCKTAGCTPSTEITGSTLGIGNGYFKYTIPSADVGAAGAIVRYWLQASDGTNTGWFKGPGDTAFQITTYPAGSASIAGTVYDSVATTTAIADVTIYADGTGFNTKTASNGTYTLSNLPQNTYDIIAVKSGYADRTINGVPATAAGTTGINFYLGSGGGGGFGGDVTKPRVNFSGPPDGQTGIPGSDSNFKIFFGFSKAMSQTAITTAGNMYVKVLDPATGATTDITTTKGSWAYYATSPGGNIPSGSNIAVWSLSAGQTFGDNKTILVIATPSVTDTAGNAIQGNQSDGSYAISFTTGSTASFTGFNTTTGGFQGGGTFGQGQFMPPHVTGATPPPGMMDVSINQKIVFNFSEAMADDAGSYTLKDYIKLYTLSGNPPYTETAVSSNAYSVSLNTAKTAATVSLTSNMTAGARYRAKVLGGAKASTGITMSMPGQETTEMFRTEFTTSSTAGADTSVPTITGVYPIYGATGMPVNMGAVNVGFNKDMDASTITTSNFYLSVGSTAVNGTVEYRPAERQAYFTPKTSLNATTTYTLNLTASILALNGQALVATTSTFTTSGADTTIPTINFINADDYSVAITFSEPMNAAQAVDTLNYSSSVLKSSLYTIKQAASSAENGTTVTLGSSAALTYDATTNTVIIKGVSLTVGNEVYVLASTSIKDAAGNAIALNSGDSGKAPVQSSATTKGALGPMGMSTDAYSRQGSFTPQNFSSATYGFAPPIDVKPFSMLAGQTTTYGIRLPISKQITTGGTVVLTFPTGFDVSGAKQDIYSPMRADLNGPGPGAPTFKCLTNVTGGKSCATTANSDDTGANQGGLADDGVVVNSVARTVTVYLSSATNSGGNDFLSIDIAGIKNSTVPKDFNTTGYTVDIKTKNSSTLLESLTSMPFFIQSGGSYAISGTITATGASTAASTTKVYLGSPMTGPMETTVTFDAGPGDGTQASYSFSSLAAGEYFLFTDPSITLGAVEFVGKQMPERIAITNANVTYNFSLTNANTTGTAVTIQVKGPASEPIDIFANSPTSFKVKSTTLDADATNYDSITFKLADGDWMVGVGPQMPKGPMAGPAATPSYLPPQPINVIVQSSGSPAIVENSDTANDGTLKFTLTSANKYIRGTVKDGSSKVIANAEVYAYSPQGGMGTHAQSASDGTFSLGVTDGTYIVGSFVPGMPSSKEVPVVVSSDSTSYLFIDGATTGVSSSTAASTFILKVAKPDYTISGKVTDGANVVQGASVYAYRSDGPGGANANTDSSGNYTLYVSAGSWRVGVFLPQYGQLTEQSVTITTSNATNQNFAPSTTGTFKSISGTVTVGGTAKQGAFVRLNGNNTFNEAITGADGAYSLKAPTGNGYVLKLFIPGMGEASTTAAFNVSDDITGKDFAVGAAKTITVLTSSTVSKAFIELMSINGIGGRAEITNATSTSLSLPTGNYKVQINIPGVSLPLTAVAGTTSDTAYATSTGVGVITVDGNESLTVTLPTLRTVSGTVNVSDAWVEIINPTNGIHTGAKTSSTTPSTFSLQVTDSSADYIINAMKPGYYRDPSTLTVNGANPASQSLTLTASTLNISGSVFINGSGAANAFVRAEKQGGGFTGTQADATGAYSLPVTAGTWKVYAVAEGYAETYIGNTITITTASSANNNINLSTAVSLNAPKSKPITPSSGGTLEDTNAGVKLTIPANALGQSTSAGNVQAKETNNVHSTTNAQPVNGRAIEIKATDSSGNAITTLSDSVTVEMNLTNAELAATASASDSSINSKTEADKLQMGYWDETTASWVTLPSTVTYYKSDGTVLDSSDAAHTPADDLSNVATTTVSAATSHFSLYAPISATAGAPSTPSGLTGSTYNTSQINLSWTAVSGATSYDLYRSTSSGGTFSRLGSEPTTTNTSYSDTGLNSGTTYYYKVSAINASGESAASNEVSATTQSTGGGAVIQLGSGGQTVSSCSSVTYEDWQTTCASGYQYRSVKSQSPTGCTLTTAQENDRKRTCQTTLPEIVQETKQKISQTTEATPQTAQTFAQKAITIAAEAADIVKTDLNALLSKLGFKRDLAKEGVATKAYVKNLIKDAKTVSAEAEKALTNFITYGTDTTLKLGAGERAGVVNSYKSAFGKLPSAEKEWSDAIKIANGRWPAEKNLKTETAASQAFKKIYKREPNRANANDDAAVTVIAYGLRPTDRNLNSEKAAIKSFKSIYGYAPKSATAWDIVRAIAYSGAKR